MVSLNCYMSTLIPENAENYLTLTGSPTSVSLDKGESNTITLSLFVDPEIKDVYNFEFDIVIVASRSDSTPQPSVPSSSGGWVGFEGGTDVINNDVVTIPSNNKGELDNSDFVVIGVVLLALYLLFGKKK